MTGTARSFTLVLAAFAVLAGALSALRTHDPLFLGAIVAVLLPWLALVAYWWWRQRPVRTLSVDELGQQLVFGFDGSSVSVSFSRITSVFLGPGVVLINARSSHGGVVFGRTYSLVLYGESRRRFFRTCRQVGLPVNVAQGLPFAENLD